MKHRPFCRVFLHSPGEEAAKATSEPKQRLVVDFSSLPVRSMVINFHPPESAIPSNFPSAPLWSDAREHWEEPLPATAYAPPLPDPPLPDPPPHDTKRCTVLVWDSNLMRHRQCKKDRKQGHSICGTHLKARQRAGA